MLKRKSVEQIMAVLKRFQIRQRAGDPVTKAYQQAVEDVSKEYDVAYQTIGDLCRRRLGLGAINEFYNRLEKWVAGDPKPLAELLASHTSIEGRQLIEDFFQEDLARLPTTERDKTELFSVRIEGAQARKLKAMLLVKGISVSDWLSKCVTKFINEEYKSWLATEAKQVLQ